MTASGRIHARITVDPATGCWLWTGAVASADGEPILTMDVCGGPTLIRRLLLGDHLGRPLERHERAIPCPQHGKRCVRPGCAMLVDIRRQCLRGHEARRAPSGRHYCPTCKAMANERQKARLDEIRRRFVEMAAA
jgi:hypothetical protein